MTIKEAWLSIAYKNFLCNQVNDLQRTHKITEKQASKMLKQLDLVRKQMTTTNFGYLTSFWVIGSPERVKFAKMAARGHAKDYIWKNTYLATKL